ncbi:hypothetical protein Holit_01562 [Hollandina sp. SP2]
MIGVFQGPLSQSLEKKGRGEAQGFSATNQCHALMGRFRNLLLAQQTRFDSYLAVLDKQYQAIENGETENVIFYVELGEKFERELFAIQKAALPLEKLYRAMKAQWSDISALKAMLETRKEGVSIRLKRNQDLLAKRMTLLRSQIQTLQASPLRRTSVYASAGIPSYLDIRI